MVSFLVESVVEIVLAEITGSALICVILICIEAFFAIPLGIYVFICIFAFGNLILISAVWRGHLRKDSLENKAHLKQNQDK
jgi:hypothetical protein